MPPKLTISLLRSEGVRGAWVYCMNMRCRNYAYITWERMRVRGTEEVRDLEIRGRLRCSVCGSREVRIRPYWTQPPD